jgi:hypothetical protein
MAESIPTQDKLRTLAQWLQVPAEWLRFGGALLDNASDSRPPTDNAMGALLAAMNPEELKLVEALHALEQDERRLVRELVQLFFRKQERLLLVAVDA